MNDFKYHSREVLESINSHRALLFLGSGTTLFCRNPHGERGITGNGLAKEIIKELNNGKEPDFDLTLMEASEYYTSMMTSGKKGLDSFIKKRLSDLQPTIGHYIISSLPWRAVVTTNFDVVIEDAWKTGQSEGFCESEIIPIATESDLETYFHSTLSNRYSQGKLQVPLFKPHGSISNHHQIENALILRSKDYFYSELIRQNMYKAITHLIKDSVTIFVGYSLSDYTFRNILYTILNPNSWTSPIYSISPVSNQLRFDWMKNAMADNFNAQLINLSFDAFMLHLLKQNKAIHPALKKRVINEWELINSDNISWLDGITLSDFENLPST